MGNKESNCSYPTPNTNLLSLIKQKNWEGCIFYIKKNPSSLQSMLPIYYAFREGASLEVIKLFHETYTDSINASLRRKLPLYKEPPLEVISYLREAYPKGIEMTDNQGSSLLHIACTNAAPLDLIKYIFERYPRGITQRNHYGRLPLHCACEGRASLEVIEYLCGVFPPGLEVADNYGDYAIDIALRCSEDEEVIDFLSNPFSYELYSQRRSL